MNTAQSNRWVVASAMTVAGIYGYTFVKKTNKATPGQFATAWGVTFFALALLATAAPGLAASFAILVMVVDLLANFTAGADIRDLILTSEGQTSVPATQQQLKAAKPGVTSIGQVGAAAQHGIQGGF